MPANGACKSVRVLRFIQNSSDEAIDLIHVRRFYCFRLSLRPIFIHYFFCPGVITCSVSHAGSLLHRLIQADITYEYVTPSLSEFRNRITGTLERFPYLVLEEDGVIQGYAYAGPFHSRAAYSHCCELSIYLDHNAKGRGYGRKLYEALEDNLRGLGFLNLYACIGDPITEDEYLNHNSEQFHQHLGFTKIGIFHRCGRKFDRWYNMIYMEKLIG